MYYLLEWQLFISQWITVIISDMPFRHVVAALGDLVLAQAQHLLSSGISKSDLSLPVYHDDAHWAGLHDAGHEIPFTAQGRLRPPAHQCFYEGHGQGFNGFLIG